MDRYTKTMMTIVGFALLALAIQNGLQRAGAQWDPMNCSTYGFCQGDRGAVMTSLMSIT